MKKRGQPLPVGRWIVGVVLLLGTTLGVPAQTNQVELTGLEWRSGQFQLLWSQAMDRYIVEQFDLQGEKLVAVATSTGTLDVAAMVYPDADALSFFRVRAGIAAVFLRDPALEAVIRSAIAGQRLGPTNWVYDAELAALSELRLSLVGLHNVAGLGAASALATLDAGGNSLQSLADLAGCTSLQSLRLDGNELTSLQGLETLQQLRLLDVSQNLLMSLGPLAGLLNLQALYAEGNQVTDLSALSGLTQLGLVDLSDNAIRDLTPLLENARRGGLGSGDVVYLSGNPLDQPAQVAELRGYGFFLILDEIEDPHNVGALIRTAECAGVHGVILPKHHAAGLNETVAKTSAGASIHLPATKVTNIANTLDELRSKGVWIVGTDMKGEKAYDEMDYRGPIAIVIGNEGKGIRRLVKEKCDFLVKIPMYGKIGSLNASVAGGLVLFAAARSRHGRQAKEGLN